MLGTFLQKVMPFSKSKDSGDSIEARLIQGQVVRPKCSRPSVFFFTTHKAASSHVGYLLRRILMRADYWAVDYSGHQFASSQQTEEGNFQFQDRGFYYGPWRERVNDPTVDQSQVIVQLRDPLDVLTSNYFSLKFSHAVPAEEASRRHFLERRQRLHEITIDAYALEAAAPLVAAFNSYAEFLQQREQPYLLMHYEQMVGNFDDWLDTVIAHLQIGSLRKVKKVVREIKAEADFTTDTEDVMSHKRQVMPGDHLRKLQPDTIKRLRERFAHLPPEFYGQSEGFSDARQV